MDDGTPTEFFNLGFTIVAYFVGSHLIQLWEVFSLLELVSLVKVFRLFRLEQIFCFGVQSVDTLGTCTTSYLLAGPAYL